MITDKRQRLFFALWPDAHLQLRLHEFGRELNKAFGGRIVARENIHLTLAFLGSVSTARIDEVLAIGQSVRANRFSFHLARTGCWKRAAVGWVAPMESCVPLEKLALSLRGKLETANVASDRKPFCAHVTLVRKAQCQHARKAEPGNNRELIWDVTGFSLVRSDTRHSGPFYTEVERWILE